ncbi:MAG: helix-turn-helix transcriptional regulator [Deltaproteobacteria bacterium]|nr:helix-turn-helix transcriptional regulator [Deltaproteobacteria bacterium]
MFINTCIRRLREARGWSRYRLGKEAGITRSQIANVEQGKNTSLDTFSRLLLALDVQQAVIVLKDDDLLITLKEAPSASRVEISLSQHPKAKGRRSKSGSR